MLRSKGAPEGAGEGALLQYALKRLGSAGAAGLSGARPRAERDV